MKKWLPHLFLTLLLAGCFETVKPQKEIKSKNKTTKSIDSNEKQKTSLEDTPKYRFLKKFQHLPEIDSPKFKTWLGSIENQEKMERKEIKEIKEPNRLIFE